MTTNANETTGRKASAASRATPAAVHERFFPGLEGLRGLAVLAVLFFHGGFSWAKGGFLGVSTFFTLSGFLITTNILRRGEHSGGLSLRDFWNRRFRRLLPAAIAAIALAALYTAVAGDPTQRQNFSGDSISSLVYVANWHFIFSGQAYAALFSVPSALLHFWSLAIEEQFYLLFPLLAVVVFKLKLRRLPFGLILTALLAASIWCTLALGLSDNAIYLGTETRAGEILIGAIFAVIMTPRRTTRLTTDRSNLGAVTAVTGIIALIIAIAAYSTVGQNTRWLYRGGLTAFALISLALIAAAITPVGLVRTILASKPLRSLGLISYGVYLYHWPIFLWLSPENTNLSAVQLFLPRVAISIALATASFHLLERPIKNGRRLLRIPTLGAMIVSTAVITVASIIISVTAPASSLDFPTELKKLTSIANAAQTVHPTAPRYAMFGDSTAFKTDIGLVPAMSANGAMVPVVGGSMPGCPLVLGLAVAQPNSAEKESERVPAQGCDWHRKWPAFLAEHPVDAAVVMFGPWEVLPHRIAETGELQQPGDLEYDRLLRQAIIEATDLLAANVGTVIWVTPIPSRLGKGARVPQAWQRYSGMLRNIQRIRPDTMRVIDLAGWYASAGLDDRVERPDGFHLSPDAARRVADQFLVPEILRSVKETTR
jgi:peptidoglycan/LPS O-acetylase OafA/YrhL